MSDTKIDTEIIDGQSFDIFVESTGQFHAIFGDAGERAPITAATKKDLIVKLRRAVKSHRKVRIPAMILEESSWRRDRWELVRITLTGINGRTNNVCFKRDGRAHGGIEQLGSQDTVLKVLTSAEDKELRRLWKARGAAISEYEKYRDSLEMNPKKVVEAAVRELTGELSGESDE